MEYLVGGGLAVGVFVFAWLTGFDRERVFYPTVTVVVASYYVLFAVMGGSRAALVSELVVAGAFVVAAVMGFRRNLWWAAAALVGHGVFDVFHHLVIDNQGLPSYWPGFCMTYDVAAGVLLAVLLTRRPGFAVVVREAGLAGGVGAR